MCIYGCTSGEPSPVPSSLSVILTDFGSYYLRCSRATLDDFASAVPRSWFVFAESYFSWVYTIGYLLFFPLPLQSCSTCALNLNVAVILSEVCYERK